MAKKSFHKSNHATGKGGASISDANITSKTESKNSMMVNCPMVS